MANEGGWYGPDTATFGDRLAAAREASEMSQEQLSKRLGVKVSTLAGWEEDRSEPRANRLSMLSGLLNVSIVWLLTGRGEGLPDPVEDSPERADMQALLLDLRKIREEMRATSDRVGLLEKRLRRMTGGT